MSPLVTSLMLLMVVVINTLAAPHPGTDTDEYQYDDSPPIHPIGPRPLVRGKRWGCKDLDMDCDLSGFLGKLITLGRCQKHP